MKRYLPLINNVVTAVLVVCALLVTGNLVKTMIAKRNAYRQLVVKNVPDWQSLTVGKKPSIGLQGSRVQIVEFSDYECTFCQAMESSLQSVVADHPDDVAVYRLNYPQVKIHPHSYTAAIAAECAIQQGHYEDYQSKLFSNGTQLGKISWSDVAGQAGVRDIPAFNECLEHKGSGAVVIHDIDTGKALSIQGTPALVINGRLVAGAVSVDDLKHLVKDAM